MKILAIGLIVLFITIGLSGCIEDANEDTNIEIISHTIKTYEVVRGGHDKFIGNGFIHVKDDRYTMFRIDGTIKNIGDEILKNVKVHIKYYDSKDNILREDEGVSYSLYINETADFYFIWYDSGFYPYFDHVDHINFEISY